MKELSCLLKKKYYIYIITVKPKIGLFSESDFVKLFNLNQAL